MGITAFPLHEKIYIYTKLSLFLIIAMGHDIWVHWISYISFVLTDNKIDKNWLNQMKSIKMRMVINREKTPQLNIIKRYGEYLIF